LGLLMPRPAMPPLMLGKRWWNWGPSLMPAIGAGLILLKTFVIIFGLQLLRYATLVEPRRKWKFKILGLSMAMAIGPLMELSAYGCAPQTLLAPLDGFDVIWNILLAPYTLGETLSTSKVVGSGFVFAGAVSAPMFGPQNKSPENIEDLRTKFVSRSFLGWVLVCISLALFAGLTIPPKNGARPPARRGLLLAMAGGFLAGQRYFMSSTATVLRTSWDEGNWEMWEDPLVYFILGGMLFCAATNAVLLNKGLAEFEAMMMVPTFVGTSIVTTSVSAAVILKETATLGFWRLLGYWFGIFLVVTGLLIIARDARRQQHVLDENVDMLQADARALSPLSPLRDSRCAVVQLNLSHTSVN